MMNTTKRALPVLCLLLITAPSAWSSISIVGGLTREMTLRPGERRQGQILVRNNSEEAQQVKAYQTDYLFWADGTNDYGEPGTVARSNATWVSFAPRVLTIPGGETAPIHYTVRAPDDNSLTGTYWSLLMVEPVPEASLDPERLARGQLSVQTILRYALQFVTHIGDEGEREMRFSNTQLLPQEGRWILQLDAENTGQRWLRPLLWAEVFDEQGMPLGRFETEPLRIFPGCSVRFEIDLSSLPIGSYSALVVGDSGDDYVFGARYELSIK